MLTTMIENMTNKMGRSRTINDLNKKGERAHLYLGALGKVVCSGRKFTIWQKQFNFWKLSI